VRYFPWFGASFILVFIGFIIVRVCTYVYRWVAYGFNFGNLVGMAHTVHFPYTGNF